MQAAEPSLKAIFAWLIAVWTLLFAVVAVPLGIAKHRTISEREITSATVSDHRVPQQGRGRVRATITFDRPSPTGPVRCTDSDFVMGDSHDASALVNEITVAIRSDSCFGAIRLPVGFPNGIGEWILAYLGSCFALALLFLLTFLPEMVSKIGRAKRDRI